MAMISNKALSNGAENKYKYNGQYNFDSIKICHNNKELKRIKIGKYVNISKGYLMSISSKDESVNYSADSKQFIIKN